MAKNNNLIISDPAIPKNEWQQLIDNSKTERERLQNIAQVGYLERVNEDGDTPQAAIDFIQKKDHSAFAIKYVMAGMAQSFGSLTTEKTHGGLYDIATVKGRKGANKKYFNKLGTNLFDFLVILQESQKVLCLVY